MKNFMSLQKMTVSDLDAVCVLDKESFPTPWRHQIFENEMSIAGAHNLILRIEQTNNLPKIAAYSCFRILADKMHLIRLAVHPDLFRQGIGLMMVRACLFFGRKNGAARAVLEVRESNLKAVGLYKKAGFAICSKQCGYYPETREAALVMSKDFSRRQHEYKNRYQRLWADRTSSFPGGIIKPFVGSGGHQ